MPKWLRITPPNHAASVDIQNGANINVTVPTNKLDGDGGTTRVLTEGPDCVCCINDIETETDNRQSFISETHRITVPPNPP